MPEMRQTKSDSYENLRSFLPAFFSLDGQGCIMLLKTKGY